MFHYSDFSKLNQDPRWLVLYYDFNQGQVVTYNVLSHPYIVQFCEKTGKRMHLAKFEEMLKIVVYHEFGGRAQWELGVSSKFPSVTVQEIDRLVAKRQEEPHRLSQEVKIIGSSYLDVLYQLLMNWKPFVHYVYRHREQIIAAAQRRRAEFLAQHPLTIGS